MTKNGPRSRQCSPARQATAGSPLQTIGDFLQQFGGSREPARPGVTCRLSWGTGTQRTPALTGGLAEGDSAVSCSKKNAPRIVSETGVRTLI